MGTVPFCVHTGVERKEGGGSEPGQGRHTQRKGRHPTSTKATASHPDEFHSISSAAEPQLKQTPEASPILLITPCLTPSQLLQPQLAWPTSLMNTGDAIPAAGQLPSTAPAAIPVQQVLLVRLVHCIRPLVSKASARHACNQEGKGGTQAA